jgi:hypothetical protein
MADIVRGAAGEAIYRLHQDVDLFREDRGRPAPAELRERLASTAAAIESLIGLDHAVNDAMD